MIYRPRQIGTSSGEWEESIPNGLIIGDFIRVIGLGYDLRSVDPHEDELRGLVLNLRAEAPSTAVSLLISAALNTPSAAQWATSYDPTVVPLDLLRAVSIPVGAGLHRISLDFSALSALFQAPDWSGYLLLVVQPVGTLWLNACTLTADWADRQPAPVSYRTGGGCQRCGQPMKPDDLIKDGYTEGAIWVCSRCYDPPEPPRRHRTPLPVPHEDKP